MITVNDFKITYNEKDRYKMLEIFITAFGMKKIIKVVLKI